MTLSAQLSKLTGRKIRSIKLRPFPDGNGGLAYNPVILLDNGTRLVFIVQETEAGEYGVKPMVIAREPVYGEEGALNARYDEKTTKP